MNAKEQFLAQLQREAEQEINKVLLSCSELGRLVLAARSIGMKDTDGSPQLTTAHGNFVAALHERMEALSAAGQSEIDSLSILRSEGWANTAAEHCLELLER